MIHISQLLKKNVVELARGNFCSASGQFYECEFFVWDVLVAAGVVVGEDKVLIDRRSFGRRLRRLRIGCVHLAGLILGGWSRGKGLDSNVPRLGTHIGECL